MLLLRGLGTKTLMSDGTDASAILSGKNTGFY